MKKQHFQAFAVSSLLLMSSTIFAEEMSPVSVFGSQDETQQAGSAHYISDDEMILRIKRFTRSNLTKVTVKMLEEEFGLDYNELNNLSKGFKPAKYIKEQRVALTKKMLLNEKPISEISQSTGYSETYLVKNKYRFLK